LVAVEGHGFGGRKDAINACQANQTLGYMERTINDWLKIVFPVQIEHSLLFVFGLCDDQPF